MARASKELTARYLQDPDTLAVAVVPATAPTLTTSNQGIAFVLNAGKQDKTIIAARQSDE
jgi:hypothetical protein